MRSSTILIPWLVLTLTVCDQRTASGQPADGGATFPVNGFEIYYRLLGEGDALLLLHTFGGCGAEWEPHLGPLSRHYRLIIADLPGQGRSTDPPYDFTHGQAARDVFALLDHLGIQRFKAMGLSSGG